MARCAILNGIHQAGKIKNKLQTRENLSPRYQDFLLRKYKRIQKKSKKKKNMVMLKRFLFVLADHENQEQITTKLKIKVKISRFLF